MPNLFVFFVVIYRPGQQTARHGSWHERHSRAAGQAVVVGYRKIRHERIKISQSLLHQSSFLSSGV